MIRRHQLVLVVNICAFPFRAHNDAILGPFKMLQRHFTESQLGCLDGRLAAESAMLSMMKIISVPIDLLDHVLQVST
jgi:hypothetical protein